ncbi:hypothetical protein [Chitinilyticum aquatile]|uniref:hypothetical protein n=1 Tax=Chitinilyticum aquatile TaxID=362520 RepID=UPI0012DF75F5|nr:hypothetical protein [Chitinilyticum aquatile]
MSKPSQRANTAASSMFPPTELMPARKHDYSERHDLLKKSLIYRIKRDALHIVAEMNQGRQMENCELMARQLAFVQKELIQAAYHDESLPKEQRQALARYHAVNIRQGLGERRTQSLRGIVAGKSAD